MTIDIPVEQPQQAIVSIEKSRYGLSWVDLGLDGMDIALFNSLDIRRELTGNWFGSLEKFQEGIVSYLEQVGDNQTEIVGYLARRIAKIAGDVFSVMGKEVGWFYLKSTLPKDPAPLKRWHMDGKHFRGMERQYKFAVTLQGFSTLFYPLPIEKQGLRRVFWRNMQDLPFTNDICDRSAAFVSPQGAGAFLIIGQEDRAALHAEPDPLLPRLFFSIVPCQSHQLKDLKERIQLYDPPSEHSFHF